jgi:hypothetical protein
VIAERGLTVPRATASIEPEVQQPRQIYASAADRRHGRRWARRHRSWWVPASLLAVAVVAGEALRGLA